ncbi:hypothetical protein GDO78_006159 [Eleutherodactylus coqui]|uniref:Uncharacterized protein n=1 Tax=Eleutherodactylus coqui TaxID=57060 RepID=A0A8J6FQ22_ELECQ|nr:hypothetical protein GDO78_006159 [Eleutherodactylus coqui]
MRFVLSDHDYISFQIFLPKTSQVMEEREYIEQRYVKELIILRGSCSCSVFKGSCKIRDGVQIKKKICWRTKAILQPDVWFKNNKDVGRTKTYWK